MKKWNSPEMEELDLNATEYSKNGGARKDGVFTSENLTVEFYGPSSGNDGKPAIVWLL